MNSVSQTVIALDVGEKRIGVAWGDTIVRIASPLDALDMADGVVANIAKLIQSTGASTLVLGLPRNQSGAETAQTQYVRDFAHRLNALKALVVFQDESLTSVMAEQRLEARGKKYCKADIDSEAAAIILTDYLERNYS